MNKDELLRIYSAYLPYGLMIETRTDEEIKTEGSYISKLTGIDYDGLSDEFGNAWDFEVRPLLYDLSYLTKEIEHEGKKVMPYKLLFDQDLPWDAEDAILNEALSFINNEKRLEYSYPYDFWQKLLSMHFNIFNLPESEYINKATLTNK